MLKWCAYCQKFLSESPPYEQMTISHGMCDPCATRGLDYDNATEERLAELVRFQRRLWALGMAGDTAAAGTLFDEVLRLRVRPVDFLLGFMAPFLQDAGRQQHAQPLECQQRIHAFCSTLLLRSREHLRTILRPQAEPDVLLLALQGNQHVFALQLLELWLQAEGILAEAYDQGLSETELLDLCIRKQPKAIGFSVALPEQVPAVRSAVQKILTLDLCPPLLLVGGHAVKNGSIGEGDIPGASLVRDDSKTFLILKTHLSLGFLYDLKRNRRVS